MKDKIKLKTLVAKATVLILVKELFLYVFMLPTIIAPVKGSVINVDNNTRL
jgi:hypothetical protein